MTEWNSAADLSLYGGLASRTSIAGDTSTVENAPQSHAGDLIEIPGGDDGAPRIWLRVKPDRRSSPRRDLMAVSSLRDLG